MTVSFSGHRALSRGEVDKIAKALDKTNRELIARGVDVFIAGGAEGFDTLAALSVLYLRREHPHIKLVLALPYRRKLFTEVYESVLSQADEIVYISEDYHHACMFERNRYMVDHADTLVYYLTSSKGGTSYTVDYAKKNGCELCELLPRAGGQLSF